MEFNLFSFFRRHDIGIGLDISDRSIKLLQLQRSKKGQLSIGTLGYSALGEQIIDNGKILDEAKFVASLKEIFQSAHPQPISSHDVLLAIPESKAFIDIYRVPDKIRGKALQAEIISLAARRIPFEPGALYFDFRKIGYDKETQENEFFYVASPKRIINSYLSALDKAELKPIAFDLESASLVRALIGQDETDGPILILDMGARTINLSICIGQKIQSSAVLPFGGNYLTREISQRMKLSFEDADKLKISLGFSHDGGHNQILPILENFYSQALKEIKRQISYYEGQSEQKVTQMIICGGSSLMEGIDRYLEQEIKLKVKRINPWEKWQIAISSQDVKIYFKQEAEILYTTVIGLALRGLENNPARAGINLLNFEG